MSFDERDSDSDYFADMADDHDIGRRIKEVRGDRTQEAFGKVLGVSRGAVGNWELGKGIKRENLQLIAARFSVGLEWLAAGRGARNVPTAPNSTEMPNAIVGDKLTERGEYIPLYGHAVGGIDGEFILNGNKLDEILAPPGLSPAHGAYAVICAGESMVPRYFDGETIYVDPETRVRRGDFVVAQIHNPKDPDGPPLAYIKRFVRHNDNELVLEQFNPAKELRFPHAMVVSVHFVTLGGRAPGPGPRH